MTLARRKLGRPFYSLTRQDGLALREAPHRLCLQTEEGSHPPHLVKSRKSSQHPERGTNSQKVSSEV